MEGDKGHGTWGLTVGPGPEEKHAATDPPGLEFSLSVTHGRDPLSGHLQQERGSGSGDTL